MKKKLKRNLMKDEVKFAENLAVHLGYNPDDPRRIEMDELCRPDYGGFVNACNRYMLRTIKAIKNRYMSLDGFTVKDAESFGRFLSSKELDENLQNELNQLLFGADERAKYFD